MLTIIFELEKETKNTIRFKEVCDDTPTIGTLYVPKATLKELKYEAGNKLQLTISIK